MIEIKRIARTELPDLSRLFEELSGKPGCSKKMAENFEWIANNEDYILLGAFLDGKLAGSLMGIICHDLVGECQPFMVIENVIVSKNMRGCGIGKQLMQAIERLGKERNCYYTMFVSGTHRKDAHRFYESLGYRLDEVQGFKKYL
jgi:GNAT superfamily N-acetyltransferase